VRARGAAEAYERVLGSRFIPIWRTRSMAGSGRRADHGAGGPTDGIHRRIHAHSVDHNAGDVALFVNADVGVTFVTCRALSGKSNRSMRQPRAIKPRQPIRQERRSSVGRGPLTPTLSDRCLAKHASPSDGGTVVST